MWTYNGKRIREGRAWTDDNGVQHPANWAIWSEAEKVAHGLVWVTPQPKPDERFYWFSQNADGTVIRRHQRLWKTSQLLTKTTCR
jgi:hypothetical protein